MSLHRPFPAHPASIYLWACLLTILFLVNARAAAAAGTIRLKVTSKTSVSGRQVAADFIVSNQGSDDAFDVSLNAEVLERSSTIPVSQRLRPGESSTVTFRDTLPENMHGALPMFVVITYRDINRAVFSTAALAVVRTESIPDAPVKLHVKKRVGRTRTTIVATVVDPLKSLPEIVPRCHVSDDMSVSRSEKTVRLDNGLARARFFIRGRGEKTGRYAVFVTAEYSRSGSRCLEYCQIPIEIGPSGPTPALRQLTLAAVYATGFLAIGILSVALVLPGARKRMQRMFPDNAWPVRTADGIVLLVVEAFILSYLSPEHLLTETIATGGDTASHYYTLHYLRSTLLPQYKISGWTPGNYAGFPMLQFYFPLPFLLMCALNVVVPLQIAFKWVTLLGVFLLPVAAFVMLRRLDIPFPGPAAGAVLTLPFLFNPETSAWGGNILSVLAGEFS